MSLFLTSDLHIGHANISRLADRPFMSVEEMNGVLIDNWNDVVQDSDTVWVLGDVAMGKIADSLPLVELLKGEKHLVAGNHDRCWHGKQEGRGLGGEVQGGRV